MNEQRKRGMAKKVIVACGGSVRGKSIALLGLAFKRNTDACATFPCSPLSPARGRRREGAGSMIPPAWTGGIADAGRDVLRGPLRVRYGARRRCNRNRRFLRALDFKRLSS